jgi:hypothetical protein
MFVTANYRRVCDVYLVASRVMSRPYFRLILVPTQNTFSAIFRSMCTSYFAFFRV